MSAPQTQNLTILFTDIKGFTEKTSRQSRAQTLAMLEKHKELVLPLLEDKGGRLVKTIGDAFLVVFGSPTDAVLAGIQVQEGLKLYNTDRVGDDRIDVRIAINTGEVTLADNDVYGEAVNIAARIEGIAEAGEVFFTEATYLAMNKREVPSAEIGLMQLKGIPNRIRTYKVVWEQPVEDLPPHDDSGLDGQVPGEPAPKARKVAVPVTGGPAKTWRRAVALLIDVAVVSILASTLTSADADVAHFEYTPSVKISENNIALGEGEDRVDIGFNEDGVEVKTPVRKDVVQGTSRIRIGQARKSPWFALFWVAYTVFFIGFWGATPGKKILKLVVVMADGSKVDWPHAAIRGVFSVVSGAALGLGYAWGLFDRTWHDSVATTKVVDAEAVALRL